MSKQNERANSAIDGAIDRCANVCYAVAKDLQDQADRMPQKIRASLYRKANGAISCAVRIRALKSGTSHGGFDAAGSTPAVSTKSAPAQSDITAETREPAKGVAARDADIEKQVDEFRRLLIASNEMWDKANERNTKNR